MAQAQIRLAQEQIERMRKAQAQNKQTQSFELEELRISCQQKINILSPGNLYKGVLLNTILLKADEIIEGTIVKKREYPQEDTVGKRQRLHNE